MRALSTQSHSLIFTSLIIICISWIPLEAKYGGGTGEPNDPYLIYNAEQMNAIGNEPNDWEKHFLLTTDIDLTDLGETPFDVIGAYREQPFRGVFDGNGHSIINLVQNYYNGEACGLFGFIDDPNAEICNLKLINPNISSTNIESIGSLAGTLIRGIIRDCGMNNGSVAGNIHVGGLVGLNQQGVITNCYAESKISGKDRIGGLVGANYEGTISNSSAHCEVIGDRYVGGLLGYNDEGAILGSYANGTIQGTQEIGGLIGHSYKGRINDCFASGTLTGASDLGGLVGVNISPIVNCYALTNIVGSDTFGGLVGWNDEVTIVNTYAVGAITVDNASGGGRLGQNADFGGLVGYNNSGAVINSFWNIDTTGMSTSDGGKGLTTSQMQDPNTYLGWSHESAWTIDPGNDYPKLRWEGKIGQPLTEQIGLQGKGTSEDPYLIYTAEELKRVGAFFTEWDKSFVLMADIDFYQYSPNEFNIIGVSSDHPFTGKFDGSGHKILGLNYRSHLRGEAKGLGMFGYLDGPSVEIRNLGLVDPNIEVVNAEAVGSLVGWMNNGVIDSCWVEEGAVDLNTLSDHGQYIGGLVGYISTGSISNCWFTGSVIGGKITGGFVGWSGGVITESWTQAITKGSMSVGGLVGQNWNTILDCHAKGQVEGKQNLGGLVGNNTSSTNSSSSAKIDGCYSTCDISGGIYLVGGLVGYNVGGIIQESFATGSVTGSYAGLEIGGLVGRNTNLDSNIGIISNSYATGDVYAQQSIGGLVGANSSMVIHSYSTGLVNGQFSTGGLIGSGLSNEHQVQSCFWDVQSSGRSQSRGGTGKTTTEMQTENTFLEAGWDFMGESENGTEEIWWINEGQDYPRLWWEFIPEN